MHAPPPRLSLGLVHAIGSIEDVAEYAPGLQTESTHPVVFIIRGEEVEHEIHVKVEIHQQLHRVPDAPRGLVEPHAVHTPRELALYHTGAAGCCASRGACAPEGGSIG